MTPRNNHLGALLLSTQRVVQNFRHNIARSHGHTVTLSTDEARAIADRLDELCHELREAKAQLAAQDLKVPVADPALTSTYGEPVV